MLVLFVWLFRRTEYTGVDELMGGENLFFRLDPLLGIAAMLGARQVLAMFWPALIVVALTLLFGRFFCGWVCPLGTLLDYFHRLIIAGPLSFWKRARASRSQERGEIASRHIFASAVCSLL
jgi:polyferredoxin